MDSDVLTKLEAGAEDATAIRAVLAAAGEALRARDAAALARCYAADARIADLAPPLMRDGIDVAGLQAWLDGWDGPVEIETRDLRITASGDLALVHGLQRTAARRDGEDAAWWSRLTLGLARTESGWRIVHMHESVPFHMDGGMRAAVDLQP